ncbi:hypothetical protein H0H93_007985, partial [Arthromyces matolae]
MVSRNRSSTPTATASTRYEINFRDPSASEITPDQKSPGRRPRSRSQPAHDIDLRPMKSE